MSKAAMAREEEAVLYTQAEIDAISTEELIRIYKQTGREELKWPLVLRYQGFVKSIALQIRGIYSSFAQVDDIISEGVITLMDAVDKFDLEKGVKFETYVAKRVRGMIIDLARRQDWMPRSVRRRAKEIDEATGELYSTFGKFPTDAQVAERLGISQARYQEDLSNIALCNVMSLEALFEEQYQSKLINGLPSDDIEHQPEEVLAGKELGETLADGIRTLRENEQLVLSLYYQENLNMKEIAQVMSVSEPRVSQIHSRAIQKLRVYMEQYMKNG